MKKIARFLVPVCFAVVLLMDSCISNNLIFKKGVTGVVRDYHLVNSSS